jgi:hypothetical protein
VAQLEGGQPWSTGNLAAFARAFGCDPVELLGGVRLSAEERAVISAIRAGSYEALMRAALAAMAKG